MSKNWIFRTLDVSSSSRHFIIKKRHSQKSYRANKKTYIFGNNLIISERKKINVLSLSLFNIKNNSNKEIFDWIAVNFLLDYIMLKSFE